MLTNAEKAALIQAATEVSLQRLDTVDATSAAELERLYRDVTTRLQDKLNDYSTGGYFETKYLRPYLDNLYALLKQLRRDRKTLIDDVLEESATLGASVAMVAGGTSASADLAIAYTAKAIYELELADGLQLSPRLWKVDAKAKNAIGKALRSAVAEGQIPMEAAREFLRTDHLQGMIGEQLMTGKGSALYNAQRLFQTETKRAHAIAYVKSNEGIEGLKGYKFRLSPLHKRRDICDDHAGANLYGLGVGVYPANEILKIFPAHPNTTSSIVAVFT